MESLLAQQSTSENSIAEAGIEERRANMEDRDLIRMFWERNETAISEAQKIYQRYIRTIAKRILGNDQDAEEVENTVYLKLWNRIPPEDPPSLKAMVGMLTRQTAIDERRKKRSQVRGEGAYEESLEELAECLPGGEPPAISPDAGVFRIDNLSSPSLLLFRSSGPGPGLLRNL
jgi:RNA polymerase sigma-70 factor (ECF subfamily)